MSFLWEFAPQNLSTLMERVMTGAPGSIEPLAKGNEFFDGNDAEEYLSSSMVAFKGKFSDFREFLKSFSKDDLADPFFRILCDYLSATTEPFLNHVAPTDVSTPYVEPFKDADHHSFRSLKTHCDSQFNYWISLLPPHVRDPSFTRCQRLLEQIKTNSLSFQLRLRIRRGLLFLPSSECAFLKVNNETVIQAVVSLITQGLVSYPFKRSWLKDMPSLFSNFESFRVDIRTDPFSIPNVNFRNSRKMYPLQFDPPVPIPGVPSRSFVTIFSSVDDYHKMDTLSDFFNEHVRLSARRSDQKMSHLEAFSTPSTAAAIVRAALAEKPSSGLGINPETLREGAYRACKECTQFKPSLALAVYRMFGAKSILDISAGWGDRLLAAMAARAEYFATDPNVALRAGHAAMAKAYAAADVPSPRVIYEPFETASLEGVSPDLIFTSPPFFDFEIYAQGCGQSVESYPRYADWMVYFLFASLQKAFDALRVGGFMVIHITDVFKTVVCEPMCLFMDAEVVSSRFCGVIASLGAAEKPRPMWVWAKMSQPPSDERRDRAADAKGILRDAYKDVAARLWSGEGRAECKRRDDDDARVEGLKRARH